MIVEKGRFHFAEKHLGDQGSCKKVLWKYAANLGENTMPKCDFNQVAKQL